MAEDDTVLAPLENKSSPLFFVAAGLMGIVAGLFAAEVFLDRGMETLLGIFAPAGFGIAFLGLLGLYSTLVDRASWSARVGAIALGIGVVGTLVLVVGHTGELAGLYAEAPAWVGAGNLLLLVGVVLGFGAFGVGVLRTGTQSRSVGLLLLWPPVVFGGLIIVVGTFILGANFPHWVHVGHSFSEAVVYLSIGYLIRTGERSTERARSAQVREETVDD